MSSLINEINKLISKEIFALLFKVFNGCLVQINRYAKHLLLRKTDFLKTSILRKENLKTCTTFEEQNGTRLIRGNVYFGIIVFSCLSSIKPSFRFLLICFGREIKCFYQSSLGNEVETHF